MSPRAIFIAATGQNVGKTTICLGVISGLRKRFSRVGFIKPVGQQHRETEDGEKVDKDAILFKEHFGLDASYSDISPVIIPAGFTRRYLSGDVDHTSLKNRIHRGFENVTANNDFTVVEGTGHVGVGDIIDLNNARVAADLGLDIVLIASGGLGSAHDELALNIEACHRYRVRVRGVILNRVLEAKREMILEYFPKALAKYDIPLLGCVPYSNFLSSHSMEDFETLFNTKLVSGHKYRFHHFYSARLVAGSLEAYLAENETHELVITPASRDDIVEAILREHRHPTDDQDRLQTGILLTGRQKPSEAMLEGIRAHDIPALYVPMCSYDAMKKITTLISKTCNEDVRKVEKSIDIVERNIDFKLLCQNDAPLMESTP